MKHEKLFKELQKEFESYLLTGFYVDAWSYIQTADNLGFDTEKMRNQYNNVVES